MRKRPPVGAALLASLPILLLLGGVLALTALAAFNLIPTGADTLAASPAEERLLVGGYAGDIVDALNQGRTAQADGTFQQAARNLGSSSEAYADLAMAITAKGRPADAARYLSEAAKDKGLNWDPTFWWALSQAQQKANDPEQAARSLAEAERRAQAVLGTIGQKMPTSRTEVQLRLAQLLQVGAYYSDDKNDTGDAIRLMEEAVRIAPNDRGALNALGYTLADKGTTPEDFDRAVELTRKALNITPDDPLILDSYGWALFKKNDLQGARRVLREAVDADPDEPDLRYHLGVVYGQLGMIDDARLELERSLVLNPDFKEAQKAIQDLRQPPGKGVVESA